MQYQLFNQYKDELMKYQRDNQDYTNYLDKVMQIFFQNRLNTLIPIKDSELNFLDYGTENNCYKGIVTEKFTSILPDLQKKCDWEFSNTLFGFYMEKGKVYFIELKEGILRIEILDSTKSIQTYIYDSLATKWLFENNLLNLAMFLNPQKAMQYVKIFYQNYLQPDFYKETKVEKNYNILLEQMTNLNLNRLLMHLEETKNLQNCLNNESINL